MQEYEKVPNLENKVMRKMRYVHLHMITNVFDIGDRHREIRHNISITTVQKTTQYKQVNTVFKTCVLKTLSLAIESVGVDRSQRKEFANRTLSVLKI